VLATIQFRTFPADLIKLGCPKSFAINAALLVSAWVALLGDSPLVRELGPKPKNVVEKFYKFLTSRPITGIIRDFASLADDVLAGLEGDADHGFIVHDMANLKSTPVFREYHRFVITGDPELLAYVLTFL
jgi:hypothetical protein